VECGSGTYVRSLVRDLGEALGCGAHVAELRRLWVDPFREPRMWTIDALQELAGRGGQHALDACLLPIESGMVAWPEVVVAPAQAARLGQGQVVARIHGPAGEVAILDQHGRALGLGQLDADSGLRPKRMFSWACTGPESTAGSG
jgi:tRNA pseudouridine55 synthase